MEKDDCIVDDTGSKYMPVRFSIEPHMAFLHSCFLDDLIRPWHQDKGMQTCLVAAPVCLLVQIDRMFQHADGTLMKSHCEIQLHSTCSMPVFNDDGVSFHYVDYTVVSLVAHLGRDQAGHCRSALRVSPLQGPEVPLARWLLTDDFQTPQETVNLPPLILQNTVVLGLVRSDCHVLHVLNRAACETPAVQMNEPFQIQPPPEPVPDATQAILNICQTLTTGNLT